jgi:hypothetical protein
MKLTRARALLGAGLIAAAGAASAIVITAGPAAAASSPVALVDCAGHGTVRPAVYDIGCMPSSEYVAGLTWTSWRSVAFGSGTLKVNDCTPTCAGGKYVKYPILTVLWRTKAWPGHPGRDYFTRLTWIFTGTRPAHARVSQTFTLPAT